MKKLILIALAVVAAASCCNKGIKLIPSSNFDGIVDGKSVGLYTIKNGDLTLQVTNYGCRVVSLWSPDKNGCYDDIVLGYDSLSRYIDNKGERFLGACVGPVANRIAKGRFTLDGKEYITPLNDNNRTLHGGNFGLDKVVWDVNGFSDSSIVFHIVHADGQEGFPGNVAIDMTYTLTADNCFKVDYAATTDGATIFNISHHSFFNLKGEGKGTIEDNEMVINAGAITPVDTDLIPTGEILDVTDTPFDFRTPHLIGERIGTDIEQIRNAGGYDHNWVLDRDTTGGVQFAASVYEPASGRFMEVFTDQPGLQFYSGNFFDGLTCGKYGDPLRYRESLALETQKFPDGINHDNFPSIVLRPGETYTQTCIYRISVR